MFANIEKTLVYVKAMFRDSEYFKAHPEEGDYRLRHTIRVANIGARIAEQEAMNVEAMTIACLLHDISYVQEFKTDDDWLNHGRTAAAIARNFLALVDLDPGRKEEICYGIAIHVDDKADFEGARTPFALTVGDADNIDRFDVYRIYENLQKSNFSVLPHKEQLDYVAQKIERCGKLKAMELGSKTAEALWQERLQYQLDFFARLREQLESGDDLRPMVDRAGS